MGCNRFAKSLGTATCLVRVGRQSFIQLFFLFQFTIICLANGDKRPASVTLLYNCFYMRSKRLWRCQQLLPRFLMLRILSLK